MQTYARFGAATGADIANSYDGLGRLLAELAAESMERCRPTRANEPPDRRLHRRRCPAYKRVRTAGEMRGVLWTDGF